jgi:large subunit ribosomal protein L22
MTATKNQPIAGPSFTARHRYARITARKARFVADTIRGRSANQALDQLQFSPQRAAAFYLKVLQSAIANASQDAGVNLNNLFVSDCRADDGPMLNNRLRWRPGPQGRAMPFAKKTSHLTVVVSERVEEDAPAKPRRKSAKKASAAVAVEVAEPEDVVEEVTEATAEESIDETTEEASSEATEATEPSDEEDTTEETPTDESTEESADEDTAEEAAPSEDAAEDAADEDAADEDGADDDKPDNDKQES